MASKVVIFTLLRVVLPLGLLAAVLFRYNALSLTYCLFLLLCPLLKAPISQPLSVTTKVYLILLLVFSVLFTIGHLSFQGLLLGTASNSTPYGSHFANCSQDEILLRQLGFQRYYPPYFIDIVRLILPDIGIIVVAASVLGLCIKFGAQPPTSEELSRRQSRRESQNYRLENGSGITREKILKIIGQVLTVLLLGASGIIHPSVIGSVYFLSFLYLATWVACYKGLGNKFCVFRLILTLYSGLHLLVLYIYQFQFAKDLIDAEGFYARLFGLTKVIEVRCSNPDTLYFTEKSTWPMFVNPALIFSLYWVMATESRRWCSGELKNEKGEESILKERAGSVGKRSSRGTERQSLIDNEGGEMPNYAALQSVAETTDPDPEDTNGNDKDKEEGDEKGECNKKKPALLESLGRFIMKQSYLCTLIAMMAWSISYLSWFGFTFLLAACLIWMIPNPYRSCMVLSPAIVIYAMILLILQFIYGLQLTEEELPSKYHGVNLPEIGLMKDTESPCIPLAIQVAFTIIFWVTLCQYMMLRNKAKYSSRFPGVPMHEVGDDNRRNTVKEKISYDDLDSINSAAENPTAIKIGKFLWKFIAKYWIFVCAVMFLAMSLQEIVIYRIIYMVLFLYFIITFQLCYRMWRYTMLAFWWIVIVYSMILLCAIYTYQFNDVQGYWKNGTGMSQVMLDSIGLVRFDSEKLVLFAKMLTPTVFLIVVIIQVNYFHKTFLRISSIDPMANRSKRKPSDPDSGSDARDGDGILESSFSKDAEMFMKFMLKNTGRFGQLLYWIIWRILEIHIFKIVVITVMIVVVTEVTAANFLFILIMVILLPVRKAHGLMSGLCLLWASLVIVAKMIYQIPLVDNSIWLKNCSTEGLPYPFNTTINSAEWVGMVKTDSISSYLVGYIILVLVLAFEAIVKIHQLKLSYNPDFPSPKWNIIFPDTSRSDADKGIPQCLKFFANYFFYKFGLEVTFVMIAVTIACRNDSYAVLYAVILGILLISSRKTCAKIWPFYLVLLVVLIIIQYASSLGLPPGLCLEYPWKDLLRPVLENWLFLPDYVYPPESTWIVADFFQLLFAALQWRVFKIENGPSKDDYGGGDNTPLNMNVDETQPNPTKDFISEKMSLLDYCKSFVFMHMFWVTLGAIFLTSIQRISIFCLGYMIGCFVILWFGQNLLLQPRTKLIKVWGILLAYNYMVIFFRACLSVLGCVYYKQLHNDYCWLQELFTVVCSSGSYKVSGDDTTKCNALENDSIGWDVACLIFILIQRRAYCSNYFRHVVIELRVQNKLASRGAELINGCLVNDVLEYNRKEKEHLETIERKMERIKKKQESVNNKKMEQYDDHYRTIRSGDYYMFEESDDDDDDNKFFDDLEKEKEERAGTKPGPLQVLNAALEGGTKAGLKVAAEDGDESKGTLRRSSSSISKRSHKSSTSEDPGMATSPVLSPTDPDKKPIVEEEENEAEDETGAVDSETSEPEEKTGVWNKIKGFVMLIYKLFISLIESIIDLLNNVSHDYRKVAATLEIEKKVEKEKLALLSRTEAIGEGSDDSEGVETGKTTETGTEATLPRAAAVDETMVVIEDLPEDSDSVAKVSDQDASKKWLMTRLILAFYQALVSRSELVCYFVIILYQMSSASIMSLPLPMSVFLWAMLSVPRPSKLYWTVLITYVEILLILKYFFQFNFFPWNGTVEINFNADKPFFAPAIIGIEKRDDFASYDVALLLTIFIHRSILKRYGLWKDMADTETQMEDIRKQSKKVGDSLPDSSTSTPKMIKPAGADSAVVVAESRSICSDHEDEIQGPSKGQMIKEGCVKFWYPLFTFYFRVLHNKFCKKADVYTAMFMCDIVTFLIVSLGYGSFGPASAGDEGDVASYLSENRIPPMFLAMLLIQFFFIIIDRGLYLRKFPLGKLIFQIFLVIFVHIWMFFVLPHTTERKFNDNLVAKLWYLTKCLYFGFSAYQIKSGYPTRILGNILTKQYSLLNKFLFKGFLAIPFLLELRTLMDWIWTDTTLDLLCWLQMEDIFANIFILKCERSSEENYPTPRGQKRGAVYKYLYGGFQLAFIVFIIWFPLLLFSFSNSISTPFPPVDCNIEITIGGYQPIFKMSAQKQKIEDVDVSMYDTMRRAYTKETENKAAVAFFNNYEPVDVNIVRIPGNSTSVWGISPPSQRQLLKDLNASVPMNVFVEVSFTRDTASLQDATSVARTQFKQELAPEARKELVMILEMSYPNVAGVKFEQLFPRLLRLYTNGHVAEATSITKEFKNSDIIAYLKNGSIPKLVGEQEWWELDEVMEGTIINPVSSKKEQKEHSLTFITFSDRAAPQVLTWLPGKGTIIGLYVSFILVIGKFMRVLYTGLKEDIKYRHAPFVDRVLELCFNVYLARESKALRLEEELFAKLIFLYRSPETMITYTRHPKIKQD